MAAAERVNKFYEDSLLVINQIPSKSSSAKIIAEINKLKTWMQKHQHETLPDGQKGKLLQTLEVYNRYSISPGSFLDKEKVIDVVGELLSDYLQLPEGRLVTANYKKKVLNWRAALLACIVDSAGSEAGTGTGKASKSDSNITRWTVEGIDSKAKQMTLLNIDNQELWKEDFRIKDKTLFKTMEVLYLRAGEEGKTVAVDLDEENDAIVATVLQ